MKKISGEKGITLVALIITIIVLLILAVVAIGAVQDSEIIVHAQNAVEKHETGKSDEESKLQGYEDFFESNIPGGKGVSWIDNGDGTFTKGSTTVTIGDYVDYNEGSYTHTPVVANGAGTSKTSGSSTAGYTLATSELTTEDLTWRVLGINEKGELELISADPTTQTLYLANDEGYVNAEDNLNNFCNDLYGKGTYATGARSLKVEDIDNLTNYDKTTYSGYGNKWTYRYPTQEEMDAFTGTERSTRYMQYKKVDPNGTVLTDWTNITSTSYQTFRLPDETTAISSNNPGSKELEYTYYYYNIANNLTTDDGFTADKATEISNMICKGTTSSNINQWLASRCVGCLTRGAFFYVRYVGSGVVNGSYLFYSYGGFYCDDCRVRPVVSLKSDIALSGSGENVGSADNMWNIS